MRTSSDLERGGNYIGRGGILLSSVLFIVEDLFGVLVFPLRSTAICFKVILFTGKISSELLVKKKQEDDA